MKSFQGGDDRIEEVIWASEMAYFTRLYKADYEGVLLLTDSLFLAWPGNLSRPLNRTESLQFMKKLVPRPTNCKITIDRGGIRITGGLALTHYLLQVTCADNQGESQVTTTRITHTWVRRGNLWRLLGGMSAEKRTD